VSFGTGKIFSILFNIIQITRKYLKNKSKPDLFKVRKKGISIDWCRYSLTDEGKRLLK
jgi:hypothetical protein